MPPPSQENSQKPKKPNSSRGRTSSRLQTPSPLRDAEGNVYSPPALAAEGKSDEEIDPSDDPAEPAGGTIAPTMAAMQHANR